MTEKGKKITLPCFCLLFPFFCFLYQQRAHRSYLMSFRERNNAYGRKQSKDRIDTSRRTSLSSSTSTGSMSNSTANSLKTIRQSNSITRVTQRENTRNNSNSNSNRLINDDMFLESVNVIVRCRGRGHRSNEANSPNVISMTKDKPQEVKIAIPEDHSIQNDTFNSNRIYTVDKVYGPTTDQMTFFQNTAENVCDDFLKGFNCTIFAYGQTGAGKTYTMCGKFENNLLSPESGIIPRCLNKLFDANNDNQSKPDDIILKCSFVEIYNEVLRDLLSDGKNDGQLKIYEQNKHIKIKSLQEFYIKDFNDAMKMLKLGMDRRKIAFTKMNNLSSRSHTIFTIYLMKRKSNGSEYQFSKMNLVDLAGSENISRSGSINQRAKEAGSINQSLLTLGRVINCLVDGSNFIPYRESKLTRLLQDSLGGRTKTILVANIGPTLIDLPSTISTLEYASKAKNIKNSAQIGPSITEDFILNDLIEENRRLKLDLLATRRRENCIVMDDSNYKELYLTEKNLKDELNELRGYKDSLMNQLNTQMVKLNKEKSEKNELHQNLQVLEAKIVQFENTVKEYRKKEEQLTFNYNNTIKENEKTTYDLKIKFKKIFDNIITKNGMIYESQVNLKKILTDQILESLNIIGNKVATVFQINNTDEIRKSEEVKDEISKAVSTINNLKSVNDSILLNLADTTKKMNEFNNNLKQKSITVNKSVDKIFNEFDSQFNNNNKFHNILTNFMTNNEINSIDNNNERNEIMKLINLETKDKISKFKNEFNKQLDQFMNESHDMNYNKVVNYYKCKLENYEKTWYKSNNETNDKINFSKKRIIGGIEDYNNEIKEMNNNIFKKIESHNNSNMEIRVDLNDLSDKNKSIDAKNLKINNYLKTEDIRLRDSIKEFKTNLADIQKVINKELITSENLNNLNTVMNDKEEIVLQFDKLINLDNIVNNEENINIFNDKYNNRNILRTTNINSSNISSPEKIKNSIIKSDNSTTGTRSPNISPSRIPLRNSLMRSPVRSPMRSPRITNDSPRRRNVIGCSPVRSPISGIKRESSSIDFRNSKRTHS